VLPVWQKVAKPFVEAGELVVLGVVQEQHPDRARLYRQWREMDWPILVDSLNLLDVAVVPVPIAIDEAGIVRHTGLSPGMLEKDFIKQPHFHDKGTTATVEPAVRPDLDQLRREAKRSNRARAWRDTGDAYFLFGGANGIDESAEAYRRAIQIDPKDGRAHFRLGTALRRRSDSDRRQSGDAQGAVEHWGRALAIQPNQYIWRRRLQQYGPRLDKPYNFYFWVEQAREEIRRRGLNPIELSVEPLGSEIAPPLRKTAAADIKIPDRDPDGRIHRDETGMVRIETTVVPARVQPGQPVRVRTQFRVNDDTRPFWNNEAQDLTMWVGLPDGLSLGEGQFTFANPAEPETQELRVLEFECVVSGSHAPGRVELPGYALYYVCAKKDGKCRFLRQDFRVSFEVDPSAPRLR